MKCKADKCDQDIDVVKWGLCSRHYQMYRRHGLRMFDDGQRCSVLTCNQPYYASGYCTKHYFRVRLKGTTELAPRIKHFQGCKVDGCKDRGNRHGYCVNHNRQLKKYGAIGKPTVEVGGHLAARIRLDYLEHGLTVIAKEVRMLECQIESLTKWSKGREEEVQQLRLELEYCREECSVECSQLTEPE